MKNQSNEILHLNTLIKIKQYQCMLCGFSSNKCSRVRHHLATHKGCRQLAFKKKAGNGFFCRQCPYKTVSEKGITAHINNHAKEDEKDCKCGKKCNLEHKCTQDVNDTAVYRCDFCAKVFNSLNVLSVHRRIHLQQKSFTCPYCPKQFCNVIAFNEHKSTHSEDKK